MKFVVILGLVLGTFVGFGTQAVSGNKQMEDSISQQKRNQLTLSISSDKDKYKQHTKIRVSVMLTNDDYVKDILIYGTLEWGYYASLTDIITDASGKRIRPKSLRMI